MWCRLLCENHTKRHSPWMAGEPNSVSLGFVCKRYLRTMVCVFTRAGDSATLPTNTSREKVNQATWLRIPPTCP